LGLHTQFILISQWVLFYLPMEGKPFIIFPMAESSDELIPTRATLLQRLKNWQDQSSWQEFFDTYWYLIYGVAIKRGLSKVEAQDVVQETLISVSKHMPAFKYDPAIGSFKAWLLNMTRWRISDQIRKRHPLAVYQECDDETSLGDCKNDGMTNCTSPDLEKVWDDEWEKNLLAVATTKARRNLDPKQYQIFDFYVNKQWEPERVAKTLAISVNQVYLAKHRVTEAIRLEVERLQKELM
jgi:RNA polymerase sigma factor (sigma-70 family)